MKCPKCQAVVEVPEPPRTQATSASPLRATPQSVPKPVPAAADQWYLQADGGEKFGPVSKADLDGWLEDGRIDASCQILCEGWEEWKWAEDVYPQLAQTPVPSEAPIDDIASDAPWEGGPVTPSTGGGNAQALRTTSGGPRRSRKKPKSLGDFFDFGFRYYLTPTLIKAIWLISLFLAFAVIALTGVVAVYASLLGDRRDLAPALIIGWLFLVVVVVFWLVVIRVVCESIIVLFNIADSLESIDHKTKPS